MPKRVTILDVARETGFSVCTVNRALTGKPHIVPETKERVLEAARRLGYTPNAIARSMGRESLRISVIYPDKWPSHFSALIEGVRNRLSELSDYRIEAVIKEISGFVDGTNFLKAVDESVHDNSRGVIFAPVAAYRNREEIFQALAASGLPHVAIGGVAEVSSQTLCNVRHDSLACGRLAGELLGLALPATAKTAIFIGRKTTADHKLKIEGLSEELERHGMNSPIVCETLDDPKMAFPSARVLFSEHPDITGVFVGTENIAGVLKYLEGAKKSGEVKLVATGISEAVVKGVADGLVNASIHQRQRLQGRLAVDALVKFLDGGEKPPSEILVMPQVLLRENFKEKLE